MSKHKQSPAITSPVSSPSAQSGEGITEPVKALEEKKTFDPERCTIEELHRNTTIHSPFLA